MIKQQTNKQTNKHNAIGKHITIINLFINILRNPSQNRKIPCRNKHWMTKKSYLTIKKIIPVLVYMIAVYRYTFSYGFFYHHKIFMNTNKIQFENVTHSFECQVFVKQNWNCVHDKTILSAVMHVSFYLYWNNPNNQQQQQNLQF